jgi:hypothetical protein
VKIVLLCKGDTEKAFLPFLRQFLENRLESMPKIIPIKYDGRIPKGDKLKRTIDNFLSGKDAYDYVIALTDVYTGTKDFKDAEDAKQKMKQWAGNNENFYPHAAQHDFEAWLLPFWPTIQKLAKHNKGKPPGSPESINHGKQPSKWMQEIFEAGKCRDSYNKQRDAKRILSEQGNDLLIAAKECPELKAFLNTILTLCDGDVIP